MLFYFRNLSLFFCIWQLLYHNWLLNSKRCWKALPWPPLPVNTHIYTHERLIIDNPRSRKWKRHSRVIGLIFKQWDFKLALSFVFSIRYSTSLVKYVYSRVDWLAAELKFCYKLFFTVVIVFTSWRISPLLLLKDAFIIISVA